MFTKIQHVRYLLVRLVEAAPTTPRKPHVGFSGLNVEIVATSARIGCAMTRKNGLLRWLWLLAMTGVKIHRKRPQLSLWSFVFALLIIQGRPRYRHGVGTVRWTVPAVGRYKRLKAATFVAAFMFALLIFPGSRPPCIVSVHELNFCVRDGNWWTLMTINTNSIVEEFLPFLLKTELSRGSVISRSSAFRSW